MRAGLVVHEGEARRTLLALRVVLAGLGRNAVIPIVSGSTGMPTRAGVNHPGHVVGEFLAHA